MTDNLYAPPKSDPGSYAETSANGGFYVVSPKKFAVLFFATLGAYQLYWFFRNWKAYRANSGESVWPVPRAFFSIFFTHSLMRKVHAQLSRVSPSWSDDPRKLATPIVILTIVSMLISNKNTDSVYSDLLTLVFLLPQYLLFSRAQAAINTASGDAEGHTNSRFSVANYIWIVLGALLWALYAWAMVESYLGKAAG
ncbi:hypothetical protein [Chitinimonas sp.]|uniref:hypothetical protein n=1 Tax=Chitinimonas sp. TaxID=1934313 RepID=UPI0035AF1DF1